MAIKYALGTLAQWNALSAAAKAEYAGNSIDLFAWYTDYGISLNVDENITFEVIGSHSFSTLYSTINQDTVPRWNGFICTLSSRGSEQYTITLGAGASGFITILDHNHGSVPYTATFKLENLKIDFSNTNYWDAAVELTACKNVEIDNCEFIGNSSLLSDAIWIHPDEDFSSCIISNCKFESVGSDAIELYVQGTSSAWDLIIKSCLFYNIVGNGVSIDCDQSGLVSNCSFALENLTFYNVGSDAVIFFSGDNGLSHTLNFKNILVTREDGFVSDGSIYFAQITDLGLGSGVSCYDSDDNEYSDELFGTTEAGANFTWTDYKNDVSPASDFVSTESTAANFLRPVRTSNLANTKTISTYADEDLEGSPIPDADSQYPCGCLVAVVATDNMVGEPYSGKFVRLSDSKLIALSKYQGALDLNSRICVTDFMCRKNGDDDVYEDVLYD